jgi:hypothetical protein
LVAFDTQSCSRKLSIFHFPVASYNMFSNEIPSLKSDSQPYSMSCPAKNTIYNYKKVAVATIHELILLPIVLVALLSHALDLGLLRRTTWSSARCTADDVVARVAASLALQVVRTPRFDGLERVYHVLFFGVCCCCCFCKRGSRVGRWVLVIWSSGTFGVGIFVPCDFFLG